MYEMCEEHHGWAGHGGHGHGCCCGCGCGGHGHHGHGQGGWQWRRSVRSWRCSPVITGRACIPASRWGHGAS